ncbi:hypothetical protein A264_16857 [Pseudomonas syringae pv. actinidiae ICMP 19071]|uniref:PAAR domain-containing protein n=1 Tax=Pseudomonas syringae TaxID=317 RepID=UPI000357AB78|nr:PAAR domain-containing protein [Pseudomonas syringae]EPM58263.1 hypothetical protein A264_16857 [Pseudomonas syringae pv. actinidiae ICMP 19071]EPM58987.1 hypothetical protein A262_10642 [Pseudomonas syringae pv. actinidiae ICMP 19073]EPM76810.1 hypothetical protein A3SO_16297 [Pseudomonas syringae pv. actinidiae ICMP 19072]OSN68198.1 hypothetical protein BV349_01305 [Pseudomonas syringae pv. actinidiae]OSN78495.1 hypothetical protein BV351_01304 [Pseudomonas syringae pv. actinidiae]
MSDMKTDATRLADEFLAKVAIKPVKNRFPVATERSTTQRGGCIVATSNMQTTGARVALVGDLAHYPDGSQSRIVSGAGPAMRHEGHQIALVGSLFENGDVITGPDHSGIVVVEYADESAVPGLLDPVSPTGAS